MHMVIIMFSKIYNSSIINNTATSGNGGLRIYKSEMYVYDSHISYNEVIGGVNMRGGVGIWMSTKVGFFNTVISYNKVKCRGGGIYIHGGAGSPSNVNMTKCVVKYNQVTHAAIGDQDAQCAGGGGLAVMANVHVTIRETSFISISQIIDKGMIYIHLFQMLVGADIINSKYPL